MTDNDRYNIRQQEFWINCRRLNINRVVCRNCFETDPRCFLGKQINEKHIGDLLVGICERCDRRIRAPTDLKSLDKKWKSLRENGVQNGRCYCGEDNPFCFEADHLDGRQYSDYVLGCCINCHLKRTSRQLTEYGADNYDAKAPVVLALKRVRGTIEYLELMSAGLRPVEDLLHNMSIALSDSRQE
jgi:hypothetical protein